MRRITPAHVIMATAVITMDSTAILRTSGTLRLTAMLRKSTRTILVIVSRGLPSKTPLSTPYSTGANRPPVDFMK